MDISTESISALRRSFLEKLDKEYGKIALGMYNNLSTSNKNGCYIIRVKFFFFFVSIEDFTFDVNFFLYD